MGSGYYQSAIKWRLLGKPSVVNCEDKYEMANRYCRNFLDNHYVSEDGRAIVDSIGSAIIKFAFDFDNVHETRTKHIEV